MNQSYILVIFVLIIYTLLGPLSVKFPILGDLKPYHIALAVASIVFCLIIISSPRSVYRSLPILVIRFWGLYLVFLIVITISAFKGLDFGKSYSLWRNYVANLFLVTLVALTIKHERQIAVVLYTLLGITIIGAILGGLQAVASPRISLAYLVGGERWRKARWGRSQLCSNKQRITSASQVSTVFAKAWVLRVSAFNRSRNMPFNRSSCTG
jgi:hypothetical protein